MTNLEFIRKSEFEDLAEYLYPRLSNSYMSFEICGKYTDFEYCECDCLDCVKKWLYDEKRDEA